MSLIGNNGKKLENTGEPVNVIYFTDPQELKTNILNYIVTFGKNIGLECSGGDGPFTDWELSLPSAQVGDFIIIKVSSNVDSLTLTGANVGESLIGSPSSPYTIYNLTPDKEYTLIYTSICGPVDVWVLSNPNPKYKVYSALLSQTGTGNPIATVLENTLGEITFVRTAPGIYEINSSDLFTENKTIIFTSNFNDGDLAQYWVTSTNWDSSSKIYLQTMNFSGTIVPQQIDFSSPNNSIEIRVYN